MRALVVGTGKMGRAVAAALVARGHEVNEPLRRGEVLSNAPGRLADVALEFTAPDAAAARVEELLRSGLPAVSGTTGWDPQPARALSRELSVPFLHSPNFSVGVAVLKRAVAAAAAAFARFPEFEPGIVERHHAAKKDAPSGTAAALADVVAEASGRRAPIASLRHGGQPGEHIVIFEGAEESVELAHRARSRAIFAVGAVLAAEWLLASGVRGPASFDDVFSGRTM
jgi:4-hydroxy-tetrahydrodipicolinate reductase